MTTPSTLAIEEPSLATADPRSARGRHEDCRGRHRALKSLAVILGIGFALRLAILGSTTDMELRIVDEKHYVDLATNLWKGNGFAFGSGADFEPTSIRPPLYPLAIAALWHVWGKPDLQVVRFAQIIVSLATCVLVYLLGARMFDRSVGVLASALLCLYPSHVAYSYFLLSEVLYFFLLVAITLSFSSLVLRSETETSAHKLALRAAGVGALLAISALVRSISWPFIVLLVPLCLFCLRGSLPRRSWITATVAAAYVVVLAPWAVRNTTLQGVPVLVDTMGGMNLCMGNYEHTPENRAWDAVQWEDEPRAWNWELQQTEPGEIHWTEGQRESWGKRHALEYMAGHPFVTARRSTIKFAALWGLEREVIATWTKGFYKPPTWFVYAGSGSILLSYVGLMFLGILGLTLCRPRDRSAHLITLALFLLICGVHTIVFGHSRYHLPLVPFLCVYAAAAWHARSWTILRAGGRRVAIPLLLLAALLVIWTRELLFAEGAHLASFLELLG